MERTKPKYEELAIAFLDLFEGVEVCNLPEATGLDKSRCDQLVEMKMAFLSDTEVRKGWSKIEKPISV